MDMTPELFSGGCWDAFNSAFQHCPCGTGSSGVLALSWGSTPQLLSLGVGVSSAACLGNSAPLQVPAEHTENFHSQVQPQGKQGSLDKSFWIPVGGWCFGTEPGVCLWVFPPQTSSSCLW